MAAVDHYAPANIFMADFPSDQSDPFDLSDCIDLFHEGPAECPMPASTGMVQPEGLVSPVVEVGDNTGQNSVTGQLASSRSSSSSPSSRSGTPQQPRVEEGSRIAFRTKSQVEIMDDGYKWRKYGKKSVKNSPNPRNYYRCSTEGCSVKKRVERDREDPSYVITTYDGIHNHSSHDVVYYTTQDSASGRFVVAGCHYRPLRS